MDFRPTVKSVRKTCCESNFQRGRERSQTEKPSRGVANGTLKNVGLGKFWQDLEISEAFLTSLEILFLHGLFILFLSLEIFYQRV